MFTNNLFVNTVKQWLRTDHVSYVTHPYALHMCKTVYEKIAELPYAATLIATDDIGRSSTQAAQGRKIECEDTTSVIDSHRK